MKGNSYYARKIHSLLGVIPLGLFIIEHTLSNYMAFEGGPEGYTKIVLFLNSLPLVPFLELFLIFIPLLFHGIYGLYVAYQSDANTGQYKYGRNWAFVWQRISGVITFIYICWHLYMVRFQVALGNVTHEELGSHMHTLVTNPIYFSIYIIGVVAATFHFSNGMWAFLVSWGFTVGPRAQKISSQIWMGVWVILATLLILALVALRRDEFNEAAAVISALSHIGL